MEATLLFPGAPSEKPKKPRPLRGGGRGGRPKERSNQHLDKAARFYENIIPDASPIEANFRHGHWRKRRDRIREMLIRSGSSVHQMNRWDGCGGQCRVEWSDEKKAFRLSANYCKSRHCEPCMRAKANLIARNLREKMEATRRDTATRDPIGLRFITLTLRHNTAPLAKQIERIHRSFKALRNTPAWKLTQTGGAATLEVKWTGTAWHPHLHIVSEGSFVLKATLVELWHQITGDSFIVDIKPLNHFEDACHYLSKYITKGTNEAVWQTDDTAQEWIAASRGVRVCNTFGSWRGFRLTKPTSTVKDWKYVDTLEKLIERAQGGELAAQGILLTLRPPGQENDARLIHTPGP